MLSSRRSLSAFRTSWSIIASSTLRHKLDCGLRKQSFSHGLQTLWRCREVVVVNDLIDACQHGRLDDFSDPIMADRLIGRHLLQSLLQLLTRQIDKANRENLPFVVYA